MGYVARMMRFLTRLAVALAALLVVIVFVIPAFLSGSYRVERTVEIDAPPSLVWKQVDDFENWKRWNPWMFADPDGRFAVEGANGREGAKWIWDGELIGRGSLTRERVEPRRKIVSRLEFEEPAMPPATTEWTFEPLEGGGGVEVAWSSRGDMPYPMMRYMALLMDQMLGPQFEEGLQRLERHAEALARGEPPPPTAGEALSVPGPAEE